MEVIRFADKNLERKIRETLNKPEGDIFSSDIANIRSLSLGYCDISDITPLAECRALEVLSLSNSNITDITPQAGLTKLTELYLDINNIIDISPLAGMENLERLSLYYNDNLTDLTPLAGLKKLIINGGLDLCDSSAEARFYMRYWPLEEISIGIECSDGRYLKYFTVPKTEISYFEEPEHYPFEYAEYGRIRLDGSVIYQVDGYASTWTCLYLNSRPRNVIVDSSGIFLEYDLCEDYESWWIDDGGFINGFAYLELDSHYDQRFVFSCNVDRMKRVE